MFVFIFFFVIFELVEVGNVYGGDIGLYDSFNLVEGFVFWVLGFVIISLIVFLIIGGYYLSCFLFKFVVVLGLWEIFIVIVFMFIIGIVVLMGFVGLFFVFGVFLVGVVLVNSEFRYEFEVNIELFKGLLLGFFFIIVGVGINFFLFSESLMLIVGLIVVVMFVKVIVLFIIVLIFKIKGINKWLFILSFV